jgi:putative CRISPR-associated protein (TIGR02619 family)
MTCDALVCTVGTSMFQAMPELKAGTVEEAAARLAAVFDPARGGAEHQSLAWFLRDEARLVPRALALIASDTDAGERAARILAARFGKAFVHPPVVVRCTDLRDDDPRRFASRGLRRLVNELVGRVERLRRDGFTPAIDATGGYKPQIAYAVLVGQVMQVPVYYRHQAFPEVMSLEPLPVSVDVEVWFDHLWFLDRLREEFVPARRTPPDDRRIAPLLEREDDLVTLSPLGELMAAAVDRLVAARGESLLPPPAGVAPEAKKVVYEDGNAGKHAGLADFCARLARVPFVTRIATRYFHPDLSRKPAVRLDPDGEAGCLEVWYGDGHALTKLRVWTTARTGKEAAAARAHLEQVLGVVR